MPRKLTLTVEGFPEPQADRWYTCQIEAVDVARGKAALTVTWMHVAGGLEGLRQSVTWPLPVRPEGPAARFFRATGQTVAIGASLVPDACLGGVLDVCFGKGLQGLEPRSFRAHAKETAHESTVSTNAAAAATTQPQPRLGLTPDAT